MRTKLIYISVEC